jgi:hypothetical protein
MADERDPRPQRTGEATSTRGGRACGAVRFEAEGEPSRVGLCHCITCRKVHGAPFNAFVVYPSDAVVITGEVSAFASSEAGRRHFCPACGSPVFARYGREAEIELPLAGFDEPDLFTPTYENFVPWREAWLPEMPCLLRHYPGNRTGTGPTEP